MASFRVVISIHLRDDAPHPQAVWYRGSILKGKNSEPRQCTSSFWVSSIMGLKYFEQNIATDQKIRDNQLLIENRNES